MADLLLFEVQLAREETFGGLREPTGVAWVSATSEEEARQLVQAQLNGPVIAEVERYEMGPPRVLAVHPLP